MWCYGTIDEVDRIARFCLNDPTLNMILTAEFYHELLSDELLGPLEHYDRILYDLIEISKIGHRYKKIPHNCIVRSLTQLDEVLDTFYLMDIGRKEVEIGNMSAYPARVYLETPTFMRKAAMLGRYLGENSICTKVYLKKVRSHDCTETI